MEEVTRIKKLSSYQQSCRSLSANLDLARRGAAIWEVQILWNAMVGRSPDHMERQWMHSVHHLRWAPTFNVQPQLLSDYNYMEDPTQGGSLSSVNLAGRSWHNDGAEKIKRTDVLDGDAESTNPQFYLSSELPGQFWWISLLLDQGSRLTPLVQTQMPFGDDSASIPWKAYTR